MVNHTKNNMVSNIKSHFRTQDLIELLLLTSIVFTFNILKSSSIWSKLLLIIVVVWQYTILIA